MKTFNELRTINVSDHIDKKNGMSYLSWTYAVDTLLQADPTATWEFLPHLEINDTIMVRCQVHAFEKTMFMQLAVFDFKNQAIKTPNAVQVSNSMMRCLVKCIACFGIGLYIYAGEDLPEEDKGANPHAPSNMQPSQDEGLSSYVSPYRFKTGKFKMRTPEEVPINELKKWVNWWDEQAALGKPVVGQLKDDLDCAIEHISIIENQPLK